MSVYLRFLLLMALMFSGASVTANKMDIRSHEHAIREMITLEQSIQHAMPRHGLPPLLPLHKRQDGSAAPQVVIPPPDNTLDQPEPSVMKSLPVAGYIPWGRTSCNSTNNPQNYYTRLQNRAYVTVAYYVNEVLGGLMINKSRHLIKDIVYNDGADCVLMKVLYERMADVDGAKFFFAPVNPDCSVLAKIAERRGMLFGNGGDYSLLILRNMPNATTAYDWEPWATSVGYDKLEWTFNLMNDITQGGESCAEAMTNTTYIDQSRVRAGDPPTRVRSAVFASNEREVPYLAMQSRAALMRRNVTEPYPMVNWDLERIVSEKCDYLGSTLREWKRLKPDFAYLISGASNTSMGVDCMHRLEYNPPAFMSPTAQLSDEFPEWRLVGVTMELPFFASVDFEDMIFGRHSAFVATYRFLWKDHPSFYELTFASSAVVLLQCILMTQSMDSLTVRTCIRTFNRSTIYGDIQFNPNGWYVDRPNVCMQRKKNNTIEAVFPLDYPNRKLWQMPSPFEFDKKYIDMLHPKKLTTTNIALIVVFSALGIVIIIGAIVFLVAKARYHWIFVPKSPHNEEWGAE